MRKIFLDVGAAAGSSVKFFRESHTEAYKFEIFCFEPLPDNIEALKHVPCITVVPYAAWDSDGTDVLYLGKYKSGTMYSDKITGEVDPDNFIEIPTIDFAEYIKEHFKKEDEIWLKLNVEGAEYDIVPHLYKNGLIDWFDRMYIRWHNHKIPSVQKKHEEVRAMVPTAMNLWRKAHMVPL
jgi:FkbM family methyltransferase